jgi:hypothetical protein
MQLKFGKNLIFCISMIKYEVTPTLVLVQIYLFILFW